MKKLKKFILAVFLFMFFDYIWLGHVVKEFNLRQLSEIGRIENGDFNLLYIPALITYFLMALAVVVFVIPQLSNKSTLFKTFLLGAVLGFIIYGVFDMTNLAILKNYPLAFVFPDIAWGAFVFGLVTVILNKWQLMGDTKK